MNWVKIMMPGVMLCAFALAGCGGEEPGVTGADGAAGGGGASAPSSDTSAASPPSGAASSGLSAAGKERQAPVTGRTRELVDPNTYEMHWIYVDWAGVDIDFKGAAEKTVRVGVNYQGQMVNEFNHAQLVEAERQRLMGLADMGRGVGYITTNIGGQLGAYDPGYGEFLLGPLTPGQEISFSVHRDARTGATFSEDHKHMEFMQTRLRITNALDVYRWTLSPEEAENVVALMVQEGNKGRSVYVRARLKLLKAHPGSLNSRPIDTELLSYKLYTTAGTLLHEVDLAK